MSEFSGNTMGRDFPGRSGRQFPIRGGKSRGMVRFTQAIFSYSLGEVFFIQVMTKIPMHTTITTLL